MNISDYFFGILTGFLIAKIVDELLKMKELQNECIR